MAGPPLGTTAVPQELLASKAHPGSEERRGVLPEARSSRILRPWPTGQKNGYSLGRVSPHLGKVVLKGHPLLPLGVHVVLVDRVLWGGSKEVSV